MRRFTNHQDKPPLGYWLNPAHPLASWVVDAVFLQEGGGTPTLLNSAVSLALVGSPSWRASGFLCNATGAGCSGTMPASLKIAQPISVLWQGYAVGTPATNASMFNLSLDNVGSAQPFQTCMFYYDGTKYVCAYSNTTSRSINDGSGVAIAGRQQLLLSGNNSAVKLYRNGVQAGTAGVGIVPAYTATSQVGFGTITGASHISGNPACIMDFAVIFNRQLTADHAQLLWTDPYDLLAPIKPRSRSTKRAGVIPWPLFFNRAV